jgi:hypothetical protein
MGASWRAHAVIGCEVTGKLIQDVSRPGCAHVTLPSSAPFCAQCGKRASVIEKEPIAGYDGDNETIGTFAVVGTTDESRQFVGYAISASDYKESASMRAILDVGAIKTALRSTLEPMGLWAEESFGLWSVLHCSY